jgi:OOP family OmpA-OmpF porin
VVIALVGASTAACTVKITSGSDKTPPPPPPAVKPPPAAPAPVPPAPKPKPRVGAVNFKMNREGGVDLPGPILFETGSAILRPESETSLAVVIDYLKQKPEVTKMRIEGHTDSDDTNDRNMKLSKDRAMAVSAYLVAKGIDCKRLVPVGFGEEKPLVTPEKSEVDKQQNRRVVFIPAERNGKSIGGKPVDGGAPGQIAGSVCPPS